MAQGYAMVRGTPEALNASHAARKRARRRRFADRLRIALRIFLWTSMAVFAALSATIAGLAICNRNAGSEYRINSRTIGWGIGFHGLPFTINNTPARDEILMQAGPYEWQIYWRQAELRHAAGSEMRERQAAYDLACSELKAYFSRHPFPPRRQFEMSVLIPIAAFAAPPAVWVLLIALGLVQKRRRTTAGHCVKCGYDLREAAARCPECGATTGRISIFFESEFVGYLRSRRLHFGIASYPFIKVPSSAASRFHSALRSHGKVTVEALDGHIRRPAWAKPARPGRLALSATDEKVATPTPGRLRVSDRVRPQGQEM